MLDIAGFISAYLSPVCKVRGLTIRAAVFAFPFGLGYKQLVRALLLVRLVCVACIR